MEIIYKKLSDLKEYDNNPRNNEKAIEIVERSIKEFGFKVPIVIDSNNVIIAGHTRKKSSENLGFKEVPCIVADDLTEEQIKAFRLVDNKTHEYSEWDFDKLEEELRNISLDMTDFDFDLEEFEEVEKEERKSLVEKFGVPPFSVLNTRQGYWQERKEEWKGLGITSEIGRDDALLGIGLKDLAQKNGINLTGTSIFDPVLCEIMYKWFNVINGKILDPFAGGSVRGIVAHKLGYKYYGNDLRKEQIEANINNAREVLGNEIPNWTYGDSKEIKNLVKEKEFDMIFTCPPYADLEVYSDDEKDLSNMDYEDFIKAYNEIIYDSCSMLKEDRFAVIVVGDIRNKEGCYRDFIGATKEAFQKGGLKLYNDLVLVEQVGTAQMRASRVFNGGRKVVKTHQNVLVFYKGNPKNIKGNYNEITIENIEEFII